MPDHVGDPVRIIVLFLVAMTLEGCSSLLGHTVGEQRLVESGDYVIITDLDVPPVPGPEGCGAQALATSMSHYDDQLDARRTAEELPWHETGATPVDILLAARDRGFEARVARGSWDQIAASVQADQPVLVMFDAGEEIYVAGGAFRTSTLMHWSVVSGFARDETEILLAARGRKHVMIRREIFMERWEASDNCMIVVTRK